MILILATIGFFIAPRAVLYALICRYIFILDSFENVLNATIVGTVILIIDLAINFLGFSELL